MTDLDTPLGAPDVCRPSVLDALARAVAAGADVNRISCEVERFTGSLRRAVLDRIGQAPPEPEPPWLRRQREAVAAARHRTALGRIQRHREGRVRPPLSQQRAHRRECRPRSAARRRVGATRAGPDPGLDDEPGEPGPHPRRRVGGRR